MKTLFPQFLENIKKNNLIQNGNTVILGFSGGKDSVTLFYLLEELQRSQAIHFDLVVAYFNHGLRTDAAKEQAWVVDFCETHGVELQMGGKDVLAFKSEHKLNLEHAASISRYVFFQELSARFPNARVATAHTKSDLTETFLIKLFRGSGLQGLSTIYDKKENTIIRPLLWFDEMEIRAFLKRNNIAFYADYTNEQDDFLRNRIRHGVVPEILKIAPEIHDHIFRTVSIIQGEYDYFSGTAREILGKGLILGKVLRGNLLKKHHVALQRHIIREYIRLLKGNLLNIDFRHIEGIRTGYEETMGLAIPGLELIFHKGYIFPADFKVPDYVYPIDTPGDITITAINTMIEMKIMTYFKYPQDNYSLVLPYSRLKFPLVFRAPVRGDKYSKINTTVNQKVFEMIRVAGFPAELRHLCPVLLNGDSTIIWVVGSPVADWYKVTDKTEKKYLKLTVKRNSQSNPD